MRILIEIVQTPASLISIEGTTRGRGTVVLAAEGTYTRLLIFALTPGEFSSWGVTICAAVRNDLLSRE